MSDSLIAVQAAAEIPDVGYVDLNRGWHIWNSPDIFTGKNGTGRWCPNVDDLIVDYEQGFRRVNTIDITTGLSTSVPWTLLPGSNNDIDVDVLLGVGTGKQSETWRVYIDTRQMPYSLQVDGRLHLYRSDAWCYKVFLGTDIGEQGQVISAYYGNSGEDPVENIPLELVATDDINNRAIWGCMAGNTNRKLDDGEVVTVVLYNATGHKLSHSSMLIQNTALVRRVESSKKMIKAIELKSPYLSDADPRLLVVPINMDIKTVQLTGVVRYNDGNTMDVPLTLDGASKMSLHGLRWYSPTIQSYRKGLTLSYRLSDDEGSLEHGVTENGFITEPFFIVADKADDAYSVKMYVFPTWNSAGQRYDLDYWLYNIDRDVYYRLPRNIVETEEGSLGFDGQNYTTRQKLKLGVKLSAVDPSFNDHRHVQVLDILLRQKGVEKGTKWQVRLDDTQVDWFGEGVVATNRFVNTNLSYLTVKSGCTSREQWLNRLFYGVQPLYDSTSEVKAPAPTHFIIQTKGRQVEATISQWDQEFAILNDVSIGETIYIRWLRDVPGSRLELGVTGMPIEQSN